MHPIRLLDLGRISPLRSQTVYHAVAHAMTPDTPDTIILVTPSQPYVCIGYHQDLEKEVDLAYCQAHGLPVVRREVGGGAVYLDDGQLFVQWIFHRDSLPTNLEARFALYVRPLVETYQALGIPAYLRPVNDIHVGGKKIGGTGAAQMEGQAGLALAEVVVGSLMFHFDKATMARVLKVPSEKMRDKIFESLEQYMTTMQEQIGHLPDRDAVVKRYIAQCSAALGRKIVPGAWKAAEEAKAVELDALFLSDEWLRQRGRLRQRGVKIHEDVKVVEGAFKAPGGLIRATARLHNGVIDDLALSGDFTLFPAAALVAIEGALCGTHLGPAALTAAVAAVYAAYGIVSPGVRPEDFAQAIMAAMAEG